MADLCDEFDRGVTQRLQVAARMVDDGSEPDVAIPMRRVSYSRHQFERESPAPPPATSAPRWTGGMLVTVPFEVELRGLEAMDEYIAKVVAMRRAALSRSAEG